MRLSPFICLLALLPFSAWAQGNASDQITQAEIKQVVNEHSDCYSIDQIDISHLEYFDLLRDGRKQAIVVASTCMTGTAGSDIHGVYERGPDGNIVEHLLDWTDPVSGPNSMKLPVFGNPNFTLAVEGGKLVAHWGDGSDRENPLIIWYKWDGKDFIVDHMKVEGPFKTSYDCGKATKEIDRAICYSPSVAALDLQLGNLYQSALRGNADRAALQQQERVWLAQREKQCVIYKWWVDCLTDMYTKRIAELKQMSSAQ